MRIVLQRLVRRCGVELHSGEAGVVGLLFLQFFLIVTFQYVSKTVRQSTFIDNLGAESLPLVYVLLAVCTVPVLLIYSRLVDRMQRRHLVASTSVVVALSMIGFWWLYQFDGAWIRVAFYVWVSIVYVLNVSQFWSFSNHMLDARQAKRLFGIIGAGGLLGGVLGGQIARLSTHLVDTRFSLLVAAAILLATAGLVYAIRPEAAGPDAGANAGAAGMGRLREARGGLSVILGSRHLRLLAAIMLLTITVANIVDVQFNWAMERATADLPPGGRLDALTGGYGNFYTILGISALVFQLLFTARIHRKLGIGVAMRILPVTMGIGALGLIVAATMIPGALLGACRLLKIGESGLRYSLDQATRELLFLPVPSTQRLKAKAYIDVFVQRSGKAAAGLLLLPVTFGVFSAVQAGWISLALIAVWLVVVGAMRREYVSSFRRGLSERTIDTHDLIDLHETSTLEALVESLGSPDPRHVLRGMEFLAAQDRRRLVPPLLLHHDDAEVRLRTLDIIEAEGRTDALPLVERRLSDEHPEVRLAAIRTIATLRHESAASAMTARLEDSDLRVRAAALAWLATHGGSADSRAVSDGLLALTSDAEPAARAAAAEAIGLVPEPIFQDQLVRLLFDGDRQVAREAMIAVKRRVKGGGFSPVYAPILVSFLQDRRLKHDAREALEALGEPIVPLLAHFMNDEDEDLWVRRGIPQTLAGIGSAQARTILLQSLDSTSDPFLRRKQIEGLVRIRSRDGSFGDLAEVRTAMRLESVAYLRVVLDLADLGSLTRADLRGPLLRWHDEEGPNLLEQLLAERLDEHVGNLFNLLTLSHAKRPVRAAQRDVSDESPAKRSHALEFLDNALSGEQHRHVFAVVGDAALDDRLRRARRILGVGKRSAHDVVTGLLDPDARGEDATICAAAIYAVWVERVSPLYETVEAFVRESGDGFVRETGEWARRRWSESAAG